MTEVVKRCGAALLKVNNDLIEGSVCQLARIRYDVQLVRLGSAEPVAPRLYDAAPMRLDSEIRLELADRPLPEYIGVENECLGSSVASGGQGCNIGHPLAFDGQRHPRI